jgi:hypothetical protein
MVLQGPGGSRPVTLGKSVWHVDIANHLWAYRWFVGYLNNFLKYNSTLVPKQKMNLWRCPPRIKKEKNTLTSRRTCLKRDKRAKQHQVWVIHREFFFTSMNSSVHKLGWGVVHNGLESLLFDMGDMHIPSPNILKVMEFQKWLTIKENLEFLLSLETWDRLALFVPLKNVNRHPFF